MSITPVLAIHGGAGAISPAPDNAELLQEYSSALREILLSGHKRLLQGQSALEAVTEAVRAFEDCPLFNAGRGAVYTSAATHELDASIMDGGTLAAGAVAGLRNVKNPVLAARAVMEKSAHVFMIGSGAEDFLRSQGLVFETDAYFHTDFRLAQLEDLRQKNAAGMQLDHGGLVFGANPPLEKAPDASIHLRSAPSETSPDSSMRLRSSPLDENSKTGTVGAVALDTSGKLAAATSTGGMTNKLPGRVGDSPIIGAGCWADDQLAVSCTGSGEFFIRLALAHDLAARVRYQGASLEDAGAATLAALGKLGGSGGFIAVDRCGNSILPFNTPGMYRGLSNGQRAFIAIHGAETTLL